MIEDRCRSSEAGFALTEFLIMLPLFVVCIAGIFHIHRTHQAIFDTLTRLHQTSFDQAFERNCADEPEQCEYSTDLSVGEDAHCREASCHPLFIGSGSYMSWSRGLLFALNVEGLDADQIVGVSRGLAEGVFDGPVDPRNARGIVNAVSGFLARSGF